jgi:hypothetical protein
MSVTGIAAFNFAFAAVSGIRLGFGQTVGLIHHRLL